MFDGVSETAEVLEAALAPRGMIVNRIRDFNQTRSTPPDARPAVIVFDAESVAALLSPPVVPWRGVPQVIIGRIPLSNSPNEAIDGDAPERRYFEKPYHYAELIEAIETLIGRNRRAV